MVAAGGADLLTVTVGDAGIEHSAPTLHVEDNKSVNDRESPTLTLEGETDGPGLDFVSGRDLEAHFRPNANAFQFEILLRDAISEVYDDGGLDVTGSKNFVQPVDTDDGEREVVYTATEAPTPRTEATGVAELDDGRCEIALPDHFGWVTDGDEAIHVQTTPYSADTGGLAVVERSTDRLVVEDADGEGDYEFSYTVRGTRDGYADEAVVREPAPDAADGTPPAPADD